MPKVITCAGLGFIFLFGAGGRAGDPCDIPFEQRAIVVEGDGAPSEEETGKALRAACAFLQERGQKGGSV
jgi:hypothetical protein